jgi:hypothetical protein
MKDLIKNHLEADECQQNNNGLFQINEFGQKGD